MVKVSVIIPAYNVEEYIEKSINSILNQTFKDIEILVINDGSTDGTLKVLNSICENNTNIVLIDKKNEGVSEARNVGVSMARGEYIYFVDADDWLHERAIEVLYNKAKEKNTDILCFNFYKVLENRLIKEKGCSVELNTIQGEAFLRLCLLGKVMPSLCTKFIKSDFIKENNIKCPKSIGYGEDLVTTINLAYNAKIVGYIDEYLYYYLYRLSSVSNSNNKKRLDIKEALNFIEKFLKDKNVYYNYREEFEYIEYLHSYHNAVIDSSTIDNFHKELYFEYKAKGNITSNKYILELIKNCSLEKKIKYKFYDRSYESGRMISICILKIKKVVRKVNFKCFGGTNEN